jgi:hypothetical protein
VRRRHGARRRLRRVPRLRLQQVRMNLKKRLIFSKIGRFFAY